MNMYKRISKYRKRAAGNRFAGKGKSRFLRKKHQHRSRQSFISSKFRRR